MKDYEKEIARKYLLPERPFLHGMASAFDMFGVLNQGKNEQLLANIQEEFEQRDPDALRSAWRKVGETLYWAEIQYEKAGGETNNLMSSDDKSSPELPDERSESSRRLSLPPELLESIPEDQRDEVSHKLGQYFLEVRREEHYSGPLQPYREAAGWNELVSGSAERSFNLYEQREIKRMDANDRILEIVEKRAKHDIELEMKEHNDSVAITRSVIVSNSAKVRRGQWIGFDGALLLFAGGIHLVNLGESLIGVGVFIFEIVAFAGVYVNETRRSHSGPL